MAEKLTPQQYKAVHERGGMLLVSAAAGSGKTKVLVDRLMQFVLDPLSPADLDEFLIITYTKAAAAELRAKIAAKLSQHISEQPDNRHLQRQMQRLYLAKISTVHSFCGDILKEFAFRADLSADFRVADENECAQLREEVLDRLLEDAYETIHDDPDLRAFVDAQGLGRDDRLVRQILLKVYDSSRCHLQPQKWLDSCIENVLVQNCTDAAQTIWGQYLMEDMREYVNLQIRSLENCIDMASKAGGLEKCISLLTATVAQLQSLADAACWDDVSKAMKIDYGTLRFPKNCDSALSEAIKAVRNSCKKGVEKKLRPFADCSASILEDMQQTAAAVRGIVSLVGRFDEAYTKRKKGRRILDFGDLEHRMLDLLLGKNRTTVTAAAREIGARYRQIMVDEYQDSNAVQDAIFRALSEGRNNCFMVGDVKQSIYQFRLADPGIFLQKYHDYPMADAAAPGEGRKVILNANFRSGGGILRSINDIFRLCMSESVGGLEYGPEEALHEGIAHEPLPEPEVEFIAVDVHESTYHEEAAVVAQRISRLLDGAHFVRDAGALRPICADDICILLRSPGSVGRYFIDALAQRGIRCNSGGGEDLLKTDEIRTIRSILQCISNPMQDIPLIAALTGPVFGFSADDLSVVRQCDPFGCMYEALCACNLPKAKMFLAMLGEFRSSARLLPVAELIAQIYGRTGIETLYGCMDGGKQRRENLQTFYMLAAQYESGGRHGLEHFLDHLHSLEDKGLIVSGQSAAPGAVTLMSIHKSKGLEFPVVFVCGLGRTFNRESARAQVLCDQRLGLGLSYVDAQNRIRYPTLARRAIAAKINADSLSEEMRVLYVALTRARDRLIMTYASQTLQKDISELVSAMRHSVPQLITRDVVCPGEWVLMAALKRTEAGALFALGGYPGDTEPGDPIWRIRVETAQSAQGIEENPDDIPKKCDDFDSRIFDSLSYVYPYSGAVSAPSKQTATQRKGREKDDEAAANSPSGYSGERARRRPSFAGGVQTAADRGTATHTVLQRIDYCDAQTPRQVISQIETMVRSGFVTHEQAQLINTDSIVRLAHSALGENLRSGREVLREFKFSVLIEDESLPGEQILLQGVVDALILEEDAITVIDFKTDFVTEQTVSEKALYYHSQVMTYVCAVERIFQRPVTDALLYFLHNGKTVSIL